MQLTFGIVTAGVWQARERPDIQLRNMPRHYGTTGLLEAGWAVSVNGVELLTAGRERTKRHAAENAQAYVDRDRVAAEDRSDPATDDDVDELVERVVRRAQYLALRAVSARLAGAVQVVREQCVEESHGPASSHDDNILCGRRFDVEEFRAMIADAARQLRVPAPVGEPVGS